MEEIIKTPIEYKFDFSSLDELFSRSKRIKGSKEYVELLKFVNKFRRYSPYNNLLVYLQNPQTTYYATVKDWYFKFKRKVKEDARPMLILAPMTPVLLVYDIEDTEGEYKPELLEQTFSTEGVISTDIYLRFLKNCKDKNINIIDFDFQSTKGGDLTIFDENSNPRIRLNKSFTITQKFATLIHELAHLFLGHLSEKPKEWKNRQSLPANLKELEAESVSYIVCSKFNIQTRADIYLFFYACEDSDYSRISIEQIMKVAGKIEKMRR